MANGIGQLDVRERRKCLFKKELRGFKSLVLASWQSHQWGSTEPTETLLLLLDPILRAQKSHQWGSTEPTETFTNSLTFSQIVVSHTNGALRSRLKRLPNCEEVPQLAGHTNGALRSRLKLYGTQLRTPNPHQSHQWGSTEPTETKNSSQMDTSLSHQWGSTEPTETVLVWILDVPA